MHKIYRAAKKGIGAGIAAIMLSPIPLHAADMDSPAALDAWVGERLNYSMHYKSLPTARAVLSLEREDSRYVAALAVQTRPMFDTLFKVDNLYRTLFDQQGLYRVDKRIHQKNIRQQLTIEYDLKALLAYADNGASWPIQPQCSQLLAMLYKVRARNPQPGESLSFLLDVESQIWRLDAVTEISDRKGERLLAFRFTAAQPPEPRKWRTDLLTNRIARPQSRLIIRLGPPPQNLPLYISFGGPEGRVDMKLER